MTNAELAILSLLAERPCHGYDIERLIEARGMRDWTEIGFSSIYYLLKKLEGKGWLVSHLDPDSDHGPARKVCTIMPEGRSAWYAAMLEALSQPQPANSSLLLGLASLPALPLDVVAQALTLHRDRLGERLEQVRERGQIDIDTMPDHVQAMFDYSATLLTAEIAWLDSFIKRLLQQKGKPDVDQTRP